MARHKIQRRFNEQVKWAFRKQKNANRLATPGEHAVILVLDGLNPSHNIGKIFRSAEVFAANSVHIINTPIFNTAPAKGAFKRVPAQFHSSFEESYQQLLADDYQIYALTPTESDYLQETPLHAKSAFVLGHEENGLSFNPAQYPGVSPLAIKQFGQTESLNVAVAASLCLYEYTKQHV